MFCHRPTTSALAGLLAEHFTVVNYDRRGRGDSGDTPPYSPRREVTTIPVDLVTAIAVPTLVLAGGASPEFFRDTAPAVAAFLLRR